MRHISVCERFLRATLCVRRVHSLFDTHARFVLMRIDNDNGDIIYFVSLTRKKKTMNELNEAAKHFDDM